MKKIVKYGLITGGSGVLIAGIVILYLFNMPHRDVQGEKASFTVSAAQLVSEFSANIKSSNAKYLDNVIIVSGKVAEIDEDQKKQKVVFLKTGNSGVNCTFTLETNPNAEKLTIGSEVKIKGILRAGSSYDEDLDLTEYAVLEKCDVAG